MEGRENPTFENDEGKPDALFAPATSLPLAEESVQQPEDEVTDKQPDEISKSSEVTKEASSDSVTIETNEEKDENKIHKDEEMDKQSDEISRSSELTKEASSDSVTIEIHEEKDAKKTDTSYEAEGVTDAPEIHVNGEKIPPSNENENTDGEVNDKTSQSASEYTPFPVIEEEDEDPPISGKVATEDGNGDTEKTDGNRERELWDRPVEFLLSCVAMSVGLGNFWRFPTTAYENGGGAFLIPYLIVLFFIGRPMYFLELSIGQFTSRSTVKIWNIVPAFRGIGYAQALASMCVVTYYAGIIAIAVFYLAMSFQKVLPWSVCDESWADMDTCVEVKPSNSNNSTQNITDLQISAEQYFRRFLLQEPDDLSNGPGVPDWRLAICLFITWVMVGASLIKGVKSHGKVSYVTALFPYVGLLTLLVQGCLLPGASEGMLYFITPRWDEILKPKVWYAAVTQSFFSLSVGFGAIMMFSSHNKFRQNVYRDATIISILDTFTSLLAGFTIFSVLGYLKHITKVESFDDIVSGGTTLVFVSYPTAIAAFETVPQLFSVLFFLVLITLGLGSSTALVSVCITILHDDLGHRIPPIYLTIGTCVVSFLLGLVFITPGGQWVLDLVDFFGGGFVIYVLTTIETIAIFWIYGQTNYLRDMRFMVGVKLGIYWKFCYAFFIPVALTALFIYSMVEFQLPTYNGGMRYPDVAYVFGWLILVCALGLLPLLFTFSYRKTKGTTVLERVKETFRPNLKHRPRLEADCEAWNIFCAKDEEGRDGGARIDAWKAIALDALENPQKLKQFNKNFQDVKKKMA